MELKDFEFKRERKLGEFVQDFINLLKLIVTHVCKVLTKLLALPIAAMLLVGYYLSTQLNMNVNYSSGELVRVLSASFGAIGIMLVIGMFAFGLAIEYFILMRNMRHISFSEKEVWAQFKKNIGKYMRFLGAGIVVAILSILPIGILMAACAIIPFVGNIAMGILLAMVGLWYFTAFMLYREGYAELIDAFQNAFAMLKAKFFEYGAASYIVQFLFQTLLYLVTLMPAIVFGILAYNSVGFNENFFDTTFGKLLTSLGGSVLTIFIIIYNILSVLSYGIIYETAKEMKFGENVFDRIAKIGRRPDAQ